MKRPVTSFRQVCMNGHRRGELPHLPVSHQFPSWRRIMTEQRPPFPPFTRETAIQKVRGAEDAWNTCDPQRVALGYTVDSKWRNRAEIFEVLPLLLRPIEFVGRLAVITACVRLHDARIHGKSLALDETHRHRSD